MIHVRETRDFKTIREAVINPYVWRASADGTCPPPELYFPPIGDGIIWLQVEDYGLIALQRLGVCTWEVHVAFNESVRGVALGIVEELLEWGEEHFDPPFILIARIPERNILARALARRSGFKLVGNEYIYKSKEK